MILYMTYLKPVGLIINKHFMITLTIGLLWQGENTLSKQKKLHKKP
jgi:hypothetical protein